MGAKVLGAGAAGLLVLGVFVAGWFLLPPLTDAPNPGVVYMVLAVFLVLVLFAACGVYVGVEGWARKWLVRRHVRAQVAKYHPEPETDAVRASERLMRMLREEPREDEA